MRGKECREEERLGVDLLGKALEMARDRLRIEEEEMEQRSA